MEPSPTEPRRARTGSDAPARRPDATEREALDYLQAEIGPVLRREGLGPVVKALRAATAQGALDPLARLPERYRRALLSAVERRLAGSRRRPSPSAVVRLASRIAPAPEPDGRFGRWLAPPAR